MYTLVKFKPTSFLVILCINGFPIQGVLNIPPYNPGAQRCVLQVSVKGGGYSLSGVLLHHLSLAG